MGDLCDGLEVGYIVTRVSNALDVDGLGSVVNGSSNILGLLSLHELGGDS